MDRKPNSEFIWHMTSVPNSWNHPNNRILSVDYSKQQGSPQDESGDRAALVVKVLSPHRDPWSLY